MIGVDERFYGLKSVQFVTKKDALLATLFDDVVYNMHP